MLLYRIKINPLWVFLLKHLGKLVMMFVRFAADFQVWDSPQPKMLKPNYIDFKHLKVANSVN
jgi:hypothetical protein